MEAKQNIAANDQEKFDPPMEWAREDAMDTLLVYLPGLLFSFLSHAYRYRSCIDIVVISISKSFLFY